MKPPQQQIDELVEKCLPKMKPTQEQIKDALKKDFRELYVKEFSTMWKMERTVREIEIGIMSLNNLMKLIRLYESPSGVEEK